MKQRNQTGSGINSRAVPAFQTSGEAREEVRKLASLPGKEAKSRLLEIARGDTGMSWYDVQVDAIEALGNDADAETIVALSEMMKPSQLLPVRIAIADLLEISYCTEKCILNLLSYIEAIDAGDRTVDQIREDRNLAANPSMKAHLGDVLKREEDRLRARLLQIIVSSPKIFLEVLAKDFGLGSAEPSSFAVNIVAEAKLRIACELLLISKAQIEQQFRDNQSATMGRLNASIRILGCPVQE